MMQAFDRLVAWWVSPLRISTIGLIRFALGLVTVFYFSDALTDVSFWFGVEGVHSSQNVAEFLQRSGLQDAAAASISPLFLTDSLWVYQTYCLLGIAIATAMMLGRGGQWICVAAWLSVVLWSNRLLWLAGLTETILSLSLFATCFAPTWKVPLWNRRNLIAGEADALSPATGFSIRLLAVQATLIGLATWLSMLAGEVWWNGTGAVALAAPESARSLGLVDSLRSPWIHEILTLAIVVTLPLGLSLAWRSGPDHSVRRYGVAILNGWAVLIAVLGSHWIYSGTLVCAFTAIQWAATPRELMPND